MKHRAIALIAVLTGLNFGPLITQAAPTGPLNPNARTFKYKDFMGRDVAGTEWKNQQEPSGDPENLLQSDGSTNTVALKGFSESHLDSVFGTNSPVSAGPAGGSYVKIESTKPIEKVEPRTESDSYVPEPAPIAGRKSESKRILLIAFASVVILAYRKFRRARAAVPWQKPSYL